MKNPETKQTTLQIQTRTESARRAGRASGRPQREAKSRRRRNARTKTAPPNPRRQRAGHGPATEKRKQSHLRRRGREAGNRPATRNDPKGHEPRRTPRGPNRRTGGPKGANNKEAPGARNNYTTAGRGSAASSKDARPRWVIMEISRVARANTAERCGSSAGAC